MKRHTLRLICVYLCLLAAFTCGMAELLFADKNERPSYTENRMLQGFPALSGETVRSGAFMDGFESYLSDAFFFREESARFSDAMTGVFSLPSDEPDKGQIDQEQLFAPDETPAETAAPVLTEVDEEAEAQAEQAEESGAAVEIQSRSDLRHIDPSLLRDAQQYLINNRGEVVPVAEYKAEELAVFAEILNLYRAALPEDGTLHFTVPPVSGTFYNLTSTDKYVDWGGDLEDVLTPVLDEGIYVYDVMDILRPYVGKERLYPVIDHHWHPVSASIVMQEMLKNQGVTPMDYYEYRFYLSSIPSTVPFYGDEARTIPMPIDNIQVMEPVSPVRLYMLSNLTETTDGMFMDRSYGGMKSYMGGIRGPWRLIYGGFHTGRNALVIGDSFELTFAPFLVPYYDTILVTDLRDGVFHPEKPDASIRTYIETYEIDDIYMLYSTYSPFCSEANASRLYKYLDRDDENEP